MKKQHFFIEAINALVPKKTNWRLDDDVLVWGDNGNYTPPTNEAIQAKADELEAQYDALQYQRLRSAEYPPVVEQLDKIFHEGVDAWKEEIQAIKDKYPKVQ